MANTYKDIIITANRNSNTADPNISFRGANTGSNTEITLRVYPDSNGTLSFDGSAGQLFSITNDLTGSIFSVNDISGIPSIEAFANGQVRLAEYSGNVLIGNSTTLSTNTVVTTTINATTANISAFARLNVVTANITTIVTGNTLTLSTSTGSNGNIIITANGTEVVRVANNGYVGINQGASLSAPFVVRHPDSAYGIVTKLRAGSDEIDFITGLGYATVQNYYNSQDVLRDFGFTPITDAGGGERFKILIGGEERLKLSNNGMLAVSSNSSTVTNATSNLHVFGNANITLGIVTGAGVNAATINVTTANVSTTIGGGSTLTIQPNVTIQQDLVVTGNLTVSGNSTTLNTETLLVEDADIVLLSNVTGSPVLNAGIIIDRGSSTNTFLRWNEVDDQWGWSDDGTIFYSFVGRVAKAGDTMTGQLNISSGGLLVTGNVGIGTTTPAALLQVVGGAIMPAAGNSATAGIQFPSDPGGGSGDRAYIRYFARFGESMTLLLGTENDADDHIAAIPGGNFGVGLIDPSSKLHVVGNANITLGINTTTVNATTINAATIVTRGGANVANAVLKTGDTMTGSLNFNFSGANLSIQQQAGLAVIEMGGANGAFIDMKAPDSDDFDFRIITIQGSTNFLSNNAAQVVAFSGANVNFDSGTLFVDAVANNVGIGTASPSAKLHISTGSNKNILFKDASHTTLNASLGSAITFSRPSDGSNDLSGIFSWNNGGLVLSSRNEMIFATGGTSSYSNSIETMRITRNDTDTGNVGIGTTSPQSKLEVATSSGQFAHFGATSTANGQFTGITLGYRENNSLYRKAAIVQEQIGDNSARGHLHLLVDIADDTGTVVLGDSKLMIHGTTGNVGIGTTSPVNKLEVNGSIAITNTTGSVVSTQSGNVFTTSAVTSYNVDTFATATFRSAKYFAQMEATTGPTYGVIELNLVHDGTTVYLSQYGETKSNASANLGVFDASITSGNLNLTFTPGSVYTAQTVKVVRLAVTD